MPTQAEYRVAKQNGRTIHTKIYLLNFNLQRTAELSGMVLDGATFNIDATSDIRRTCSISIIPTNSSFSVNKDGKIWLDKYVQIYVGIEDTNNNNNIIYTNMGIYLINNPNQVYNATNNTITINGIDMMARFTGLRNGYLEGIEYQVPANSAITGAMKACLDLLNIKEYNIETPSPTPNTPNAISISIGGTVYNIITELRDINANYQTYFDVNGLFHFNLIPSGDNEQIVVDDEIWKRNLISYNTSVSFENVKNSIEVFGKTLSDGTTPHGIAKDNNKESPFYIGGDIGEIRIVLSGGEYDNIFTQNQAVERAKYELYLRCKLQDQVSITCVPIYWLDVNWVVSITLPNKQGNEETNLYIIKRINTTLGTAGTQSITMMKYYPLYPSDDDIIIDNIITEPDDDEIIMGNNEESLQGSSEDTTKEPIILETVDIESGEFESSIDYIRLDYKDEVLALKEGDKVISSSKVPISETSDIVF